MHMGIPTETQADENRVAITVASVAALGICRSDVVIKRGASDDSVIADAAYMNAGSTVAASANDVWQ